MRGGGRGGGGGREGGGWEGQVEKGKERQKLEKAVRGEKNKKDGPEELQ